MAISVYFFWKNHQKKWSKIEIKKKIIQLLNHNSQNQKTEFG